MAHHSKRDTYVSDMAILPQEKKASYTHTLAILITKKTSIIKNNIITCLYKTTHQQGISIQNI